MPSYKVLEPGFYGGRLYSPVGKRPVLHTSKQFSKDKKSKKEKVPSWLERIKGETTAQKADREAAELEAAEQAEADTRDIEEATFLGDGEAANAVETL